MRVGSSMRVVGLLLVIAAGGSGVAVARPNRPLARLTSPALSGQFAFGVDAPVDFRTSIAPLESQYLLRKSLNRYRITGSGRIVVPGGHIVTNSSGTSSETDGVGAFQASGTITFIDQRKLGSEVELTLEIVGADSIFTRPSTEEWKKGVEQTHVHLDVRVARSNSASCPVGRTGSVFLTQAHFSVSGGAPSSVSVFLCGLSDSFTNNRWNFPANRHAVTVVLAGSAFPPPPQRRPTKPKPPPPTAGAKPDKFAVEVNGATRGGSIATGALTCTGAGFSEGTSCYVYAKPGSTIPATATIDRPLPAGWSWKILWQPYGGQQSFPCPGSRTTCTASITVPDLGGTIQNYITTPGGWTSVAMYVVACKTGETPYPGHPCPY